MDNSEIRNRIEKVYEIAKEYEFTQATKNSPSPNLENVVIWDKHMDHRYVLRVMKHYYALLQCIYAGNFKYADKLMHEIPAPIQTVVDKK